MLPSIDVFDQRHVVAVMSRELNEESRESIRQAIFAGQKIEAIKRYREATGQGLKVSKDFVEALESELRTAAPERFTAKSASGCAGVLALMSLTGLMMVTLLGCALWWPTAS